MAEASMGVLRTGWKAWIREREGRAGSPLPAAQSLAPDGAQRSAKGHASAKDGAQRSARPTHPDGARCIQERGGCRTWVRSVMLRLRA